MDDLLLFTPSKKSHIAKLEDLLKALLKMDLRYCQRNVSYVSKRLPESARNYSITELELF